MGSKPSIKKRKSIFFVPHRQMKHPLQSDPPGLDSKGCFFIFLDFMRFFGLLILDFKLDTKIKKVQNGNREKVLRSEPPCLI